MSGVLFARDFCPDNIIFSCEMSETVDELELSTVDCKSGRVRSIQLSFSI